MKIKFFILIIFLLISYFTKAQDTAGLKIVELSDFSLDKLMNIQVITASGYLQTTAAAPSTINVITAQQIAERGYEQLEDALRDVPGIDMIHLNGYAPTLIYFRGMYGAENLRALLMIDGIVENNIVGSNDIAGPAYSLHNAERIEIIWGPVSALYGANAFGGVINIITKKGGDMNGLHAEKGYGTFNTSIEKISIGLKKSKLECALSGSLYSTDGPKFTDKDPNYTASYVSKAYSLNGTISYGTKKLKTTLGLRSYVTPMGWGTILNSATAFLGLPAQGNGNSGIVGILDRDVRGEKSGLESPYAHTVFIQNEFNSIKKLNLLTRFTYRETGIGEDSYIYLTIDGHKLYRVITAGYSNRTSGEFSANYSLSEIHKFSAGIQFYQDNVERNSRQANFDTSNIYLIDGRDTVTNLYSTFNDRTYDIRNTFASYLQYVLNTKFLGITNFTFGARYDYNSYFGDAISPRVAIVNQPNDKLTLKLQYGQAFRAPTNTEIYQAPPNFPLKTEKIKTYELNFIYALSKKARVQLNGFRNELTDIIALGNLSNLTQNKNPGIITVNGLEGSLDMVFTKYFSGFLNFTYTDAIGENLITHIQGFEPGIAHIKGNIGVTAHLDNLFIISLTGNWVGERPSPITDPYGSVAGYFLTNCVISTEKLFDKGITVSLNIRNVFNTKWLDPGIRSADGFLYPTILEQPGRVGLIKIGIDL